MMPFSSVPAASVTKLLDFDNPGQILGESIKNPQDNVVIIGVGTDAELWFTTNAGGYVDRGTIVKYQLSTGTTTLVGPTQKIELGPGYDEEVKGFSTVPYGIQPKGSLVQDGNLLYYTTGNLASQSAGGTLNVHNMSTGEDIVLWESERYFVGSAGNLEPNSPHGDVVIVDRGTQGKDIYFSTLSGGAYDHGTILRYNTLTQATSLVHSFGGVTQGDGKQPYHGFTQVGDRLYYTTFTGGAAAQTGSNGAGTLGYVDISVSGSESVRTLTTALNLDGYAHFPQHDPVFDAATNSLYFTTRGLAGSRGAIMQFSLDNEMLTALHTFESEVVGGTTLYPTGSYPSGNLVIHEGVLYYVTSAGGETGNGVIGRYVLGAEGAPGYLDTAWQYDLNSESGIRPTGGLVFSDWDGTPHLYLLTTGSGADWGSLLRINIDAVPEPSRMLLMLIGASVFLVHRRRTSSNPKA